MTRVALTLCLLCAASSVLAEDSSFTYRGNESYEQGVLPPGEFFGVPLGSRFTPHHDVVRYCRYLAETSFSVCMAFKQG